MQTTKSNIHTVSLTIFISYMLPIIHSSNLAPFQFNTLPIKINQFFLPENLIISLFHLYFKLILNVNIFFKNKSINESTNIKIII